MLNLGTAELLVILVLALVVLGPSKLPDAARSLGRALSEVRRLNHGFHEEVRRAMADVPASGPAAADTDDRDARPRRAQPLRAEQTPASGSDIADR